MRHGAPTRAYCQLKHSLPAIHIPASLHISVRKSHKRYAGLMLSTARNTWFSHCAQRQPASCFHEVGELSPSLMPSPQALIRMCFTLFAYSIPHFFLFVKGQFIQIERPLKPHFQSFQDVLLPDRDND